MLLAPDPNPQACMAVESSSSTVQIIATVHQAAMLSLAFLAAILVFGGPFGLVPAEAALLAEIRTWRATGVPLPASW